MHCDSCKAKVTIKHTGPAGKGTDKAEVTYVNAEGKDCIEKSRLTSTSPGFSHRIRRQRSRRVEQEAPVMKVADEVDGSCRKDPFPADRHRV
jgi:hypothetical protein